MTDYDPNAECHYVCFYNGKTIELNAKSSYAAQQEVANFFAVPAKKQHLITVLRADVTHSTQHI